VITREILSEQLTQVISQKKEMESAITQCDKEIAAINDRKHELVANVNACIGAIQTFQYLITQIEEGENIDAPEKS
jgi:hypothetical protein